MSPIKIFVWNPPFQKLFVLRKWNGFGSCSSEGLLIFKILELLEECFILHCMSPFFENGNLLSSLHHYCIVNIALHQIIKDIAYVLFRIRKYCTILPYTNRGTWSKKKPHQLSDAIENNYSASHKHDKTMLYLQYLDNISSTLCKLILIHFMIKLFCI